LRLIHDFGFQNQFRGEEAEQAQLSEAAEEEPGVGWQSGEPACGCRVMDMALIGEGDPDVDVREKK
jgi:hypothetical protein